MYGSPDFCCYFFLFFFLFFFFFFSFFKLANHEQMFGRGTSWEEGVFNDTVVYLHARFEQLLQWDRIRLTPERLYIYCEQLDVPGQRCFGFIDGTQRVICRPGTRPQRTWYSGYKKCHGIKFQGVTTPDGLMTHLDGAYCNQHNLTVSNSI
jgi:hypothetical protein